MTWGGLDEIFNPGVKHLHDELERQRIEAKIPGNEAGGGRDSVDLDKGIVRITRSTARGPAPQEAPQDAQQDSPQDAPQDV